jgi:HSP20 family protein
MRRFYDVDQFCLLRLVACRLKIPTAAAANRRRSTGKPITPQEKHMSNHPMRFDALTDLARFEPLRSVEDFLRDFHFKHALRDLDAAAPIRLDVSEAGNAYTVQAEMPGLKKQDIQIDLDGKRVSICAEVRRDSEKQQGATVLRSERFVGRQFRSFTLEHEIDDAKAQATYRDGVLELTLPKLANGDGAKKLVVS